MPIAYKGNVCNGVHCFNLTFFWLCQQEPWGEEEVWKRLQQTSNHQERIGAYNPEKVFLLRKQRDSREPQRTEGRRSGGKMVIIDNGAILGKGGRSRNPYPWRHNTWTALHSYVTYTWWYNRISNIKCLTLFILFREIPQGVNFWCTNQSTVT